MIRQKLNTFNTKLILGYLIGLLVFIIIIPSSIYLFSRIHHNFFQITICNCKIVRLIATGILFGSGLFFTIWSNLDLFRKGKGGPTDVFNVEISPRTQQLVTNGPYRYSRNPMVFGVNSMYFSIAIFTNSLASLLFCSLFLIAIILYIKLTEEKRLLRDFGKEYAEYKKKVSMIIPFPKRKF